ncbi:MAG: helix-turn-helix transcriptional regulator [Nitrospirota bacterium]
MNKIKRKVLIKTALLKRELTQMQVANALGVSESLISKIINGHMEPKADVRKGLADLLGVKEESLFGPCGGCSGGCNCGD